MKKMKVIAHRGGFLPEGPIPEVQDKYTIPENTLEAFERALKNDWAIETDVRKWEDGNFVLIHDADSTRISAYHRFKLPTLDKLFQLTKKYVKNGQSPFIAFQIKRSPNPNSGVDVGRTVAQMIQQYNLKKIIRSYQRYVQTPQNFSPPRRKILDSSKHEVILAEFRM